MERENIVVFPGSFDPFTLGHAAVVEEALRLFDKVVIGVGDNISKRGLLDVEQRVALIRDIYAANPRVEVRSYSSLTGDFAEECGARAIVRGVRTTSDFEYEQNLAAVNRHLYPSLSTVILSTPAELSHISSSAVRELLSFGRDVSEFMPYGVDINKYLNR
ncbi:MAG: pantetheine-phosphate adenylyltransferase [Alistipes sp.]|nr:pantetheine-phosphate adenylyltransferase [Alistipes sp.]